VAHEFFLSLVKPDGIEKGLVGDIIGRFEKRGLMLVDLKWTRLTEQQIRDIYLDKQTEDFFPELLAFMQSGAVVASVWSGEDAVAKGRQVIGSKQPLDSDAGTIRGGMAAADRIHTLVHGSRSPEEAYAEMQIVFPERWEGTPVPARDRPASEAPKSDVPPIMRAWEFEEELA